MFVGLVSRLSLSGVRAVVRRQADEPGSGFPFSPLQADFVPRRAAWGIRRVCLAGLLQGAETVQVKSRTLHLSAVSAPPLGQSSSFAGHGRLASKAAVPARGAAVPSLMNLAGSAKRQMRSPLTRRFHWQEHIL